jgi:hypothetical protein
MPISTHAGCSAWLCHTLTCRCGAAPAALSADYQQNLHSARRLAGLRPRLACFGHGFAATEPGRFTAAIHRLLSAPS